MMMTFDMLTRMRVYVISVFNASNDTGGQHPGSHRSSYRQKKFHIDHRQRGGMTEPVNCNRISRDDRVAH